MLYGAIGRSAFTGVGSDAIWRVTPRACGKNTDTEVDSQICNGLSFIASNRIVGLLLFVDFVHTELQHSLSEMARYNHVRYTKP